MSLVWALDLPDSEKIVLLALADCANDEGHCWPGMRSLVKKCSKTDRTIQTAIKALVDAGHLTRREVLGKGCNYTVHPRTDFAPEAASPPKGTAQTPEAASGKPSGTVMSEAKASLLRVFDHWNVTAGKFGLHRANALNKSRTQMGLARLKEYGEDRMIEAIDKCGRSPFCRGETGNGRRADIMMILQPKTIARLLEGFYGEDEAKRPIDPKELRASQLRTAELYDRIGRASEAAEIRRSLDLPADPQMARKVASLVGAAGAPLKNFGGGAPR